MSSKVSNVNLEFIKKTFNIGKTYINLNTVKPK